VLQEAWGEISSDYLNKLTTKMPNVCKALLQMEDSLMKAKFEGDYYFKKKLFIALS
jgi:hypothetical protein